MVQPPEKKNNREVTRLKSEIRRLTRKLDRQKVLESRLNETLHTLRVHQEELRTQNDDLIIAQAEITQSHRKYRDLFDFAPVGYYLIGPSGVIHEINLTGARMIGRHRDAIIGKPLFLYIVSEFRQVVDNHLRELWEGRPGSAEAALARGDDTILPVELFSVPVVDEKGQVTLCRIAATDISKRRQAEEALRESERRLDAIVGTIPDIVYRLDRNGMIKFISESIRRYGYTPGELLGRPLMNLVHPEDRPIARSRITERRTGPRSTSGLELRLLLKDERASLESEAGEEERYFIVNAEGLYADKRPTPGHFIGTQGIAHDITKRKQGELDRLHLEAELNKARKMEAVGTLAGGIAHDFNNLLMGIQGSVSLMHLDLHAADSSQNRQRLDNIEQCVKRGSDLTQQLLGFAKRGKYTPKKVDLNKIVTGTTQLFGRIHKDIEIHQEFEPQIWVVDGDQGQLEQVLLNLLINADQAMPGGGRISLKTENFELKARQGKRLGLKPGRQVRIMVQDNGVGMDPAIQSRIFEPFFTTKEIGRGTGMGLASAYGIIKNHGGTIEVESAPGEGSCFTVYLPASTGTVAPELKPAYGIRQGHGTILLIDDEKIVTSVSSKLLKRLGYRVIVAEDGNRAESIYRERHREIDMVILDMIMPHLSGFETYNRLKKINPRIKVLLCSGFSKEGQAGEIVAQDGQDFVQKPFDLVQLSHKLAAMLDKS